MVPRKPSDIFPALCFTAFVLWLLSIPMDGPLVRAIGISDAIICFLPLHIVLLTLIALFCPGDLFSRLLLPNCIAAFVLSLALPLAGPAAGRYLLAPLGVTGAFVAIGACMSLRRSPAPLLSAAVGLVAANLLLLPFSGWSHSNVGWFAAAAGALPAIPILTRHLPAAAENAAGAVSRWYYLAFVFIFQVVCGLMYSFVMPAYHQLALLPGIELFFYVLAVLAAYWIYRKNADLALVCGVMLGMVAFALLQQGDLCLPINAGMFALQAAAGMVDLALIAILLAFPEPKRAFGVGLATLCSGILAGKMIGNCFGDMSQSIAMAGHIVLNLSVLALYFLGRCHFFSQNRPADNLPANSAHAVEMPAPDPAVRQGDTPEAQASSGSNGQGVNGKMPHHLRLLLSQREYVVLQRAVQGRTYRETARELDISESTVKTYMQRIYDKMGVKGKKKLFEMLNTL